MRSFKSKTWSNTNDLDRCPVHLFELYVSKRPLDMCEDDSPFYLSVNPKGKGPFWYKWQAMGTNKLGSIMKRMA